MTIPRPIPLDVPVIIAVTLTDVLRESFSEPKMPGGISCRRINIVRLIKNTAYEWRKWILMRSMVTSNKIDMIFNVLFLLSHLFIICNWLMSFQWIYPSSAAQFDILLILSLSPMICGLQCINSTSKTHRWNRISFPETPTR